MSTIAITGVTGFVGGRMAAYFAAKGHHVIGFGRKPYAGEIDYHRWDITQGCYPIHQEIDTVIHCAGSVTDWGNPTDMYRANVTGTRNVLATFREARQFIHISTASVYDPFHEKHAVREDAVYPSRYLNAYGDTKMKAEIAVLENQRQNRIILRPHIIYGPGDTTILPRLLKARRLGRFIVIGDGENRISLTYIENLCHAVEQIMARSFTCEIFNITDNVTDTVNNILETLRTTFCINEPLFHLDKKVALGIGHFLTGAYGLFRIQSAPLLSPYIVMQMASTYTLDISKAQNLLGYSPLYDYRQGFAITRNILAQS